MPLLTPKQAAAELGISDRQLRDLTTDGKIPYVNIGRGERETRRYEPDDIAAFRIARRRIACPSTSAPARRPTRTTSNSGVIDFQETLKKLRSEKRSASRS